MRRSTALPLILALSACLSPEGGLNHSLIQGVVRVEPIVVEETFGLNDQPHLAQRMGALAYTPLAVVGGISDWGHDADADEVTGDIDWYAFTPALEADPGGFVLRFETLPADWVVRVEVYEQDEAEVFQPMYAEDVFGTGEEPFEYQLEWAMVPEQTYAFVIGGLDGTEATPYELGFLGAHPDTRNITVGAYRSADPSSRKPVGGAKVAPFELLEDWAWEGAFEIDGINVVITEPHPMLDVTSPDFWHLVGVDEDSTVTRVDENIARAYLMAGDWAGINGSLPAGTWYTSEVIRITVPCGDLVLAEPLLLDAFAPLVIGEEVDEVEPNDLPVDIDMGTIDISDPGPAQDLGVLSGPGVVDIVRGQLDFIDDQPSWDHDVDGFTFQVPEMSYILFTLYWDNESFDLDFLISDDTGETLDLGYFNFPETSEYQPTYEPGTTYYLAIIGYLGDPAAPSAYELRMEQAAP
jgi:hypothetical protein